MADQSITTSIDDLTTFLSTHGETESSQLAMALGVSQEIVETWSTILEKADIVKISYRVGKMYIALVTGGEAGAAAQAVSSRMSKIEVQIQQQIELINQVNSKVEEFRKYVASIEGVYKSKAGEVKSVMDRIDVYAAELKKTEAKLRESKDYVDKFYEKLDKELEGLAERSDVIESIVSQHEAKGMLDDFEARLRDMESRRKELGKGFEKQIEDQRKKYASFTETMDKESRRISSTLEDFRSELDTYSKARDGYSRDIETAKRRAGREGQRILDSAAKTSQEVERIYNYAEKEVWRLAVILEGVRSKFPEAAKMNDQLGIIKKNIDGIAKERTELAAAMQEIQTQMDVLQKLSEERLGTRLEVLGEVEGKVKEVSEKNSKIRQDEHDIESSINDLGKK